MKFCRSTTLPARAALHNNEIPFFSPLSSFHTTNGVAAWHSDLIPFLRSEIEMPVKCFDCIAPTFTRGLHVNNNKQINLPIINKIKS